MWTKFVFEVVLLTVFGVFGLIGNVTLVRMFLKSEVRLNFHLIMILLALYDTLLIVSFMLVIAIPDISLEYKTHGLYYSIGPIAMPLLQVAITGSAYCTICVSFERYMTVCHPFYMASKRWSAMRYIIPVIVFSFLYNTSRFFEFYTQRVYLDKDQIFENGTTLDGEHAVEKDEIGNYVYQIGVSEFRENKYYIEIYIVAMNFIFNGIIPFASIITLNSMVYLQLKRVMNAKCSENLVSHFFPTNEAKKKGGTKTDEILQAKINLIVASVFILCNSARWIPNIAELLDTIFKSDFEQLEWIETTGYISNCLIVLNSSVNFYIYYFFHHGISFIPKK